MLLKKKIKKKTKLDEIKRLRCREDIERLRMAAQRSLRPAMSATGLYACNGRFYDYAEVNI